MLPVAYSSSHMLSLVVIFSYSHFYFSGYVDQLNIVCSLSRPVLFFFFFYMSM